MPYISVSLYLVEVQQQICEVEMSKSVRDFMFLTEKLC